MKYITLLILYTIVLFANTTMCYKNNITDISTIEDKSFDGGECNSKYSISNMKKNGWIIKDIKISQKDEKFNFIYILSKKSKDALSNNIDYAKLTKVLKSQGKKNNEKLSLQKGQEVYNKVCKSCHGLRGEELASNNSLAINTLSLEQLKDIMRAYSWGEQDKGAGIIMRSYASLVSSYDIDNIYKYLKSINK